MPILQFKGKTAIECYHHTVPPHVGVRCQTFDLGKWRKREVDACARWRILHLWSMMI